MARRKRHLRQRGTRQKERRLGVVGIDQRRAIGQAQLQRGEDRRLAVARDEHVEGRAQHAKRRARPAVHAVFLLPLDRGIDQRYMRTAEDRDRAWPRRLDRHADFHRRRHLRRRRRDAVLRRRRSHRVQPHDLFEVLDARQVEQLDRNPPLLEHGSDAQDAEAHEHPLVEQES